MNHTLTRIANAQIEIPYEQIAALCEHWQITELALFGSVLREDFHSDSDIDLLIRFAPEATPTLFTLTYVQAELEALLSRKVDLVERIGLETGGNYLIRHYILDSSKVIYAAR